MNKSATLIVIIVAVATLATAIALNNNVTGNAVRTNS